MLSVLIPTYNHSVSALVKELTQQANACDFTVEIIVGDDASSKTQILEEHKLLEHETGIHIIYNSQNLGRTQTRELLAQKAKYNWLLFLDSDVLPAQSDFLTTYFKAISPEVPLILGGYLYPEFDGDYQKILRYTYGKSREEAQAKIRNRHPYAYVFSGNMLVDKALFLKYNYKAMGSIYGLDIYFAYQLYRDRVPVLHIDNGIFHLGMETNEVFFNKQIQSLAHRARLLAHQPEIEKVNGLIKYYNLLSKYHLRGIVGLFFRIFRRSMQKQILSKKPNLRLFDLYRLGYLCTQKLNR